MVKSLLKLQVVFILLTTFCFAGYGDFFGANSRNISLAGANNLTDPGSLASKENPASLTNYKKVYLSLSYLDTNLNLHDIKSFRSSAPASGIEADNYNPKDASNLRHIGFGFILPLSKYLTFGLSALMPTDGFASIHAFTRHETNYLHYNDRQQRPEIYSSVGVKLPYGFSLGMGVFYSLKVDGTVHLGVSSTDNDARMLVRLKPEYIPYGGILYKKEKWLIGTFYRKEQKTDAKLNFDIDLNVVLGNVPFAAVSNLTAYYDPRVFALGAGYIGDKFNLFGSFRKNYWSKYRAPVVVLTGKDINSLSSSNTSELTSLQDSETYSVGSELKEVFNFKHINVSLRTGVEHNTSALKDNPKSVSVVDTERTSILFGSGFDIDNVGTLIRNPFRVDLSFQYSMLKEEDVKVINNGVVVQSAHVGGNIFTFTTGVNFEF